MQYRCTHARILFTPDYQEHCVKIGTPQCNGCKLVELRTTQTSAKQMIEDERHATKAYDFASGRMVTTW